MRSALFLLLSVSFFHLSTSHAQGISGYNSDHTKTPIEKIRCAPLQSGHLFFSASDASVNAVQILSGTLPDNSTSPGTHGTLSLTEISALSGDPSAKTFESFLSDTGSIKMELSPGNQVSGSITLSDPVIAYLLKENPKSDCVTSLALDAVTGAESPNGKPTRILQAIAYLTLSNGRIVTIGFH